MLCLSHALLFLKDTLSFQSLVYKPSYSDHTGLQCPFELIVFLIHRLFPAKGGDCLRWFYESVWRWMFLPPSPAKCETADCSGFSFSLKSIFPPPPREALKIKTSKNTFLARRKYFLAASRTLWGSVCVCVSAKYTECVFCAVLFCGHTSELGAAIIQGKTFCFPPPPPFFFLMSWRIHTALIDAKRRGKATAAPQHLCPLLPAHSL